MMRSVSAVKFGVTRKVVDSSPNLCLDHVSIEKFTLANFLEIIFFKFHYDLHNPLHSCPPFPRSDSIILARLRIRNPALACFRIKLAIN
jgi:hypothetical protein